MKEKKKALEFKLKLDKLSNVSISNSSVDPTYAVDDRLGRIEDMIHQLKGKVMNMQIKKDQDSD